MRVELSKVDGDWRKNSQPRKPLHRFVAGAFVLSSLCALPLDGVIARSTGSLTEAPRLAAVYDLILAAQFDRVDAVLRETCPPAPGEACLTLDAAALWWKILIEPDDRSFDPALDQAGTAAIASTTAWTRREPKRGEAWFYLAAAHAPLVQWRVLRGHRLAAARDGKHIKDALEQALRLDPSLEDAHFGLGLYEYYADVAPMYARFLRWMLWLPGGDRAAGLRDMQRARDRGSLLRGEADFQLSLVYLWYEQQPDRALELLRGLDRRYASNPLFLERIAELQNAYLHDPRASAATYRMLLTRVRDRSVHDPDGAAEIRARLGLADRLLMLDARDEAIREAQIVIDRHPTVPRDARARAETIVRTARERSTIRNF